MQYIHKSSEWLHFFLVSVYVDSNRDVSFIWKKKQQQKTKNKKQQRKQIRLHSSYFVYPQPPPPPTPPPPPPPTHTHTKNDHIILNNRGTVLFLPLLS